ncbi:hypothetical protein ACLB2K_002909 [Fragaria x ananassa]
MYISPNAIVLSEQYYEGCVLFIFSKLNLQYPEAVKEEKKGETFTDSLILGLNMKLKQLESLLGALQQFSNPKVELEQYPTGAHIASRMLYTVVADFGCGCGTLGLAAGLLGAEHVIGIDVDPESLELASLNAEELELDIEYIQGNIKNLGWRAEVVDTVIMNPPFGTRQKGADMDFLSVALKVASQAVYSLHKTSTRDHVKRAALRQFNASSAEVICELRYGLPQTYKFHKKREVDIAVDLWRFVPKSRQGP